MLEVTIRDEETYRKIKPHAEKSVDIVRFVVIDERYITQIPPSSIIEIRNAGEKKKPSVNYSEKDKLFYINDCQDPVISVYLSGSVVGKSVGIGKNPLAKLYSILASRILKPDSRVFNTFYFDEDLTLDEYQCFRKGYKLNGKIFRFTDEMGEMKVSDIIAPMKKEYKFSTVSEYINNSRDQYFGDKPMISLGNGNRERQAFGDIAMAGKRILVYYKDNGNIYTWSPLGVNRETMFTIGIKGKPSSIPADAYRVICYEYLIRKWLKDED